MRHTEYRCVPMTRRCSASWSSTTARGTVNGSTWLWTDRTWRCFRWPERPRNPCSGTNSCVSRTGGCRVHTYRFMRTGTLSLTCWATVARTANELAVVRIAHCGKPPRSASSTFRSAVPGSAQHSRTFWMPSGRSSGWPRGRPGPKPAIKLGPRGGVRRLPRPSATLRNGPLRSFGPSGTSCTAVPSRIGSTNLLCRRRSQARAPQLVTNSDTSTETSTVPGRAAV